MSKTEREWTILGLFATAVLGAGVALAGVTTLILVHPLKLTMTALVQGSNGPENVIEKTIVHEKEIVNLAQGLDEDRSVPKNEILALLMDCNSPNGRIVVWDTDTSMVLVNVTEVISFDSAVDKTRNSDTTHAEAVVDIVFIDQMAGLNSIDGGDAVAAVKLKWGDYMDSSCPRSGRGSLLGTISVTTDGFAIDALLSKGRLTIKPPIDQTGIL